MDAFLLVGQSNMAGRGELNAKNDTNKSEKTIINGHEILSFDRNNTWIQAKDPLHFDQPDKCGVGPGLHFAKTAAELGIIDTNRKIGLIPCAIGGTSIKQWLPSKYASASLNNIDINKEDGIFEKTIQKTILALNTKFESQSKSKKSLLRKTKNGSLLSYSTDDDIKLNDDECDIELRGILWHQGESDCDTIENANEYLSNAISLFENFRKYLSDDNVPIIVGGLGEFLGENIKHKDNRFMYYNIINETLMNLPSRLHNFGYVSSAKLKHKGDFLHFDSDSSQELGRRYAAKYAQLSGSLSNEELSKYMRFNKFKDALKEQSKKAYERTKGISFKTWLFGIAITCIAIYAYKGYYANNANDANDANDVPAATSDNSNNHNNNDNNTKKT